MIFRRLTALAGIFAFVSSFASGAGAQTKEELDRARGIFRQGLALAYAHDCNGALAKYREVAQIKMTPQLAFAIGECEEQTGKLVSALGNYRMALSSSENDPKSQKDVAKAPDRISALEARIPKVTIKRGKNADAATYSVDGNDLTAAQIGVPYNVDPGPHVLVAKQGDNEAARETVTVAENENKDWAVDLKPVVVPKVDAPVDAPPPPPPTDDQPKGKSKVPGAVVLGLGGASAVTGVIFMALRGGTISDLAKACNGSTCPPSAQSISDKGKTYTGVAEVTLALGAVGIVTGIVLLATSGPPKAKGPDTPASDAPPAASSKMRVVASAPGAEIGGVSVVGRF